MVDESNVNSLPDLAPGRAHIVKAEWFWKSVQNEGAADEKEYLFEDVSTQTWRLFKEIPKARGTYDG